MIMRKLLVILILLFVVTLSGCYSCQSWHDLWGNGEVRPGCEDKIFFDKDCKLLADARPVAKAPAPKPAPKPKPKPKPAPKPVSGCGPATASNSGPGQKSGAIQLDKVMPPEVQLNTAFDYTIKVTNVTNTDVSNVVVTEFVPDNLSIKSTTPNAAVKDDSLVWKLGTFTSKQSKTITVSASATDTKCIKTCANVTYVMLTCANVRVVEPKLKLTKTAPAEVLLCDPIPVKFVVTNPGTGAANNVMIKDTLPAGLTTADGKKKLAFNAGTLAAGQSRQFTATLKAEKTGKYVNSATATSDAGLKSNAQTTTVVRQPILTIAKNAPQKRYLGRSIKYDIKVTNKGDAPAKDLVIEDVLPTGTKFVSATNGGKAVAGKVKWNIASLKPNASSNVSVTVMPSKAGTFTNVATATATCAEGVRATTRTIIAGIPAILLEVIDIDDPIELGNNTTYVITATNQGSAPGTNIIITCQLEDNEKYVSASGATTGTLTGNKITFTPLGNLAPKKEAVWRVVVKAVKPGDVRFKVTMNTDQITRPVEETEATHLYE